MEFIDDHPVVEHQVRFRQRAIVEESAAIGVRDGDVVLWLVKARCEPPQYYPVAKDADERYKLAIQDVEAAAPLYGALRESAIVYLDHGQDQGYITLEEGVLPLEIAFTAPRLSANGLHDPAEVAEAVTLREYLSELGELHENETLTDAVRRLVEHRPPVPVEQHDERARDPEYAAAYKRATQILTEEEDPPPTTTPSTTPRIPALDEGDVEVVGTLHRGGRSQLQNLLAEAFGDT